MNRRAAALGLSDTHYANPIGLDEPGNYSSAHDLVTLTAPAARSRSSPRSPTRRAPPCAAATTRGRIDRSTNLLTRPWVTGVKTGHTFGAGYVLVGSGTQGSTP